MARFVLGLEQFSALAEGHLLELHDPNSGLTAELMLDPDIGWPRLQPEAEAIDLAASTGTRGTFLR
jgi:hypothetical protein